MKRFFPICFSFIIFFLTIFSSTSMGANVCKVPSPFDPFGIENYAKVNYSQSANSSVSWTAKDKETGKKVKHSISTCGEKWFFRYSVKGDELRGKAKEIVDSKLSEQGYKTIFADKGTHILALDNEDKTEKTWVEIRYGWNYEFRIYIYRERFLHPDKTETVVFDTSLDTPEVLIFNTSFDGVHFYMLKIDIIEGRGVDATFNVSIDGEIKIRDMVTQRCDSKYYSSYQMFNLAPYKGDHKIEVKAFSKEVNKAEITLIKTPHTITPLGPLTRKPALLKLKNSLSSLPEVSPIGHPHGDFKITGDYLPTGDAVYWLNNGYYTLSKNALNTNLVPLRSNHETTVDWPLFYEKMSSGNEVKTGTKIAIYDVKEGEDETLTIDFALSHLPKNSELTKEDFSAFEAGTVKGEVLSLENLHEPMNVVILVDSSYSMVKSMKTALNNVEAFIKTLPDDALITVVDFDTKVKPIAASSREDLIKKLRVVRADGSTALYDSVIKGLELLSGKSRASLVLFTDGKDANYNDTKRGSKATFDQMVAKIQQKNIPIYPVAFGEGADTVALNTIAKMTKTTYYKGNDSESLTAIFDEIGESLSSAYKVVVKRGRAPVAGSSSVVNYMADVSGSMDQRSTMSPNSPGCGNRFEQLKDMLAQSITALPDDYFIQLSTFASKIKTHQILTRDKARLLAGIGGMKAGGGTKIIEALQKGIELCRVVATNKRYFIFVTDATGDAFDFTEDEEKELKSALLAFKSSKIETFWLGMYDEKDARAAVENLALISGGEAFVSADIGAIKDKILSVTKKITELNKVEDGAGSVTLKLKIRNDKDGTISVAVGQKGVSHKLLKDANPAEKISELDYQIKEMNVDKVSYNYENAKKIYGTDAPLKDVRLQKIIPLLDDNEKPVSGKNSALNIELSKAYLFARLKGIGASHGSQFLVLDMKLANIMKPQTVVVLGDGSNHPSGWLGKSNESYSTKQAIPTYKIPNLLNHLFIRVNGANEVPFHPITWGLESPLTEVDENSIAIGGGMEKVGVLTFKIPDKPIANLSLHFYDTSYGHIDIPIIGELKTTRKEISKLPTSSPAKLGEAFSLAVSSVDFETEITGIGVKNGGIFEVLNCTLDSKVNALLNLEPQKRFYLRVHTKAGDWTFSPHPITKRIPMGFYKDLSVAPGSHNTFAIAFHIPENLRSCKQSLLVELKGEDVIIPVPVPVPVPAVEIPKPELLNVPKVLAEVQGDKIKVAINNIYQADRIDGWSKAKFVVDMTFTDELDNTSTNLHQVLAIADNPKPNLRGRSGAMSGNQATRKGLGGFSNNSEETKNSKTFVGIDGVTSSRVLGFKKLVLDGSKTRCLIVFDVKTLNQLDKVYLVSPIFTDLSYEFDPKAVTKLSKEDAWFLLREIEVPDYTEGVALAKLLEEARQRKARAQKLMAQHSKPRVGLDSPEELPQVIPPIPMGFVGAGKFDAISSLEEAIKALKEIEWVPSKYPHSVYSPAAIFTQNWGTEYDQAQTINTLLKSRNTEVKAGFYPLTEVGKTRIQTMAKGYTVFLDKVPYIEWMEDEKVRNMAFPFLQPLGELTEELDLNRPNINSPLRFESVQISLKLWWSKERTTAAMQMGGMGSALSGKVSEKMENDEIFRRSFRHHSIGNMPLDMWFGKGKDGKGNELVNIYHSSKKGIQVQNFKFSKGCIPEKMDIKIYDGRVNLQTRTIYFKKGQRLSDFFFTFSVASPDLSAPAIKTMSDFAAEKLKNVKKLDPFSLAQWSNRNKIYKYVGAQTLFERDLEKTMGVLAKRVNKLRTIVATLERTRDGRLISSLDLREVNPDLYGDDEVKQSFNLMAGLMATEAEGLAVKPDEPDDSKKGDGQVTKEVTNVISLWKQTEGLRVVTLIPENRTENVALFKKQELPEQLIRRLDSTKNVWLFPDKPSNGRYGWLEINPKTFKMTSVIDTGEHGAMTESVITMENIATTTRYFLGLLIGSNIAVGSVINYAMQIEDYAEIKKKAQAMAKLLACYVKKMESAAGKMADIAKDAKKEAKSALKDASKGEVPGGFDFSCDDDDGDGGEMPKKYSDYVNFGKGVDHAIAAYFANM